MRLSDTLTGVLTLVLGLAVAAQARTFPPMPGQPVGPSLFPTLVGLSLAALGLALVVAARRTPRGPAVETAAWMGHPHLVRNFAVVVADLIFYVVAVDRLGFFLTSIPFLAALMLAFGVRRRLIVPLAVAVTFLAHAVFYSALRVPLPWGLLEGMAW